MWAGYIRSNPEQAEKAERFMCHGVHIGVKKVLCFGRN